MATKGLNIIRPAEANYCKALVFGPHGNGKTRFLGTADDDDRTKPMLFLDMEGGTQTLVGRDTHMAKVRDWTDFNEAYAFLASGTSGYKSVAIDSISEVQIEGMLAILDKDTKRPDEDAMGQSEWGIILVQMRRFVRSFKDLPLHVFMSALAKDSIAPRIGAIKVPLLQGSFVNELPGIMDVIAYLALEDLENGATNRVLLLHSFPRFSVKCRTPWDTKVPAEIVDPTIGKLLDVLGYKTRKATKNA